MRGIKKENFDNSIFLDVKEEIESALKKLPKEVIESAEAQLYKVDESFMNFLKDCSQRLILEYAYDEKVYKEYNISKIVKIINENSPSHHYRIYEQEKWKQVNDRELVWERLDGSFVKYKNSLMANIRKKVKEKNIDQESIVKIMDDVKKEVHEASKELDFIKKNFEELDVRISSYHQRTKVAIIECRINKKRDVRKNLRKNVPNILWFKELTEEEKQREDNELIKFMRASKRAFGEIYYVPFKQYNKKGE